MPIVKRAAAATNQTTPVAVALMSMPLAITATISTATCRAVIANATARLPRTSSERGIGAASSSRWAPPSRSTITPSPANMVLSGISRPFVPVATNASYALLV
jgi:hypothetical protein